MSNSVSVHVDIHIQTQNLPKLEFHFIMYWMHDMKGRWIEKKSKKYQVIQAILYSDQSIIY